MEAPPPSPNRCGGFSPADFSALALRARGEAAHGLGACPDEDAARAAERAKAYPDLQAENAKKLENYAWADKAKGTVQIPIERAMELAIVELNSKQPAPAGPIATPAPSPAHHRRLRLAQLRPQPHQPRTSGVASGVTTRIARARRLACSIPIASRSAHTG